VDEMLQDFLTEAGELLSGVDNKLVDLEKRPNDAALLNEIFRGFHTIKGGAGFLDLKAMVDLCHLTENVFDLLRKNELALNATIMDSIMAATATVRVMFDDLGRGAKPQAAEAALLAQLRAIVSGAQTPGDAATPADAAVPAKTAAPRSPAGASSAAGSPAGASAPAGSLAGEPDWKAFLDAVTQQPPSAPVRAQPYGRRASDDPTAEEIPVGRRTTDRVAVARDTTIRIDTSRLDQVLTLSGSPPRRSCAGCRRPSGLRRCRGAGSSDGFSRARAHRKA